jgi:hypothetical protein
LREIVQQLGAAAGLAAVVGLAVLWALYLSQARDVKRLREWADRAPARSSSARPRDRRIGTRHVAVALVGVLVLGGATGVRGLTGGGANSDDGSASKPKRNGAAVKRGNVTVAVLNATMVPGLAASLSGQIAAAGFEKGTIGVFSDQQLAESVVQYAPGRQAEAKAVSRTVGIAQRDPVTSEARALAGGAPVIVIAGADKAP